MDYRFSNAVRDILLAGGWFEGRKLPIDTIALPDDFTLFPKAEEVLVEFDALHFGKSGRGVNCAASDVEIHPRAGTNLASHIKKYEARVEAKLYPLGYVHRRHCLLIVDEVGRIYLLNGWLVRYARNFDQSLEYLLLGVKTDSEEIAAAWGPNAAAEIHIEAEA